MDEPRGWYVMADDDITPASPTIPQDETLHPALDAAVNTFQTGEGKDYGNEIAATVQQHLNMQNVVDSNVAAGQHFTKAFADTKANLVGMAKDDPSASQLAIDLTPRLIGPILAQVGMSPEDAQSTHDQITGHIQTEIARAAVTSMADQHTDGARQLMGRLGDYLPDEDQAALGGYINNMQNAKLADNAAAGDARNSAAVRNSAVAAFQYGSSLLDPRTEAVTYPPDYLSKLVKNQMILPDDKQPLFQAFGQLRANGDTQASSPYAVSQVLHDIIDPKTQVGHGDIMDHVGNDIRYVDAMTLHGMNLQRTPGGIEAARQLGTVINNAQSNLASAGDRAGTAAYSRFVNWLLPAYRRTGQSGLDPASDNYLFKNTSWANFAPNHADAVAPTPGNRPPLSQIFGANMNQPGRDAINEGAGPIGETIIGALSGGGAGVLKGAVEGAIESGMSSTAANELATSGRAASMGVTTSTKSEIPLGQRFIASGPATIQKGVKVVKGIGAVAAGTAALQDKGLQ